MSRAREWPWARLGDVCETSSGGTPSRKNSIHWEKGTIPWVKSGEIAQGEIWSSEESITKAALDKSAAKLFPKNTVLLAMYGATAGQVGILRIEATTNQAVCAILPSQKISPEFLAYYLRYKKKHIVSLAEGGAQPNISQAIIRTLSIPLPPLSEQRRIAAILDSADAIRTKRKAAIAKLDELAQAVFLEMFGDPVRNAKRWTLGTLLQLGTLDRGVSKHRPRNDPVLLGGAYPLIQTGDVANSFGYIREHYSTYSEIGLRQSRLWRKGTLCITIAANIAKTGILTFDACFPDSVVGFIPKEEGIIEYVRFWFSFLQEYIEKKAPASAQKNINLEILRNFEVPIPPIYLMSQFQQKITEIGLARDVHSKAFRKEESLFSSLQHRAFAGEL